MGIYNGGRELPDIVWPVLVGTYGHAGVIRTLRGQSNLLVFLQLDEWDMKSVVLGLNDVDRTAVLDLYESKRH